MADNLKLTFDFRMDGADQVSRTVKNLAQDLNNIPRSAQDGLKVMNDNLNSILKSLSNISAAQTGFQLDKSMEKAFGAEKANLVRNLKREIEDLNKQIDSLGSKTVDWNVAAKSARKRGLGGVAEQAEANAADTALAKINAQELRRDAQAEFNRVTQPAGAPPGLTQRGMAALNRETEVAPIVKGVLEKLGLGGLATAAGGLAVGAGMAAYAGFNYLATGQVRGQISQRRYEEISAQEAIYANDPTRAFMQRNGIGPEAELLNSSGLTPTWTNLARGGMGFIKGSVAALTGGSFSGGVADYMKGLGDLGKEQFADLQRAFQMRNKIGGAAQLSESVLGQEGTYSALTGMTRLGVDLDSAAPALNALVKFGANPGTNSDSVMALLGERFGVSPAIMDQVARRAGYNANGITSILGKTPEQGSAEVQRLLASAGLGSRRDFAARESFSEFANENLTYRGFTGSESIGAVNAGLAASILAARTAAPGLTAVDATNVAGSQFQAERRAQETAMDPRRVATVGALVSQGLSYAEAEVAIRMGLDNPEVRKKLSNVIAKRTGKSVDVGGLLTGARKQLDTAFDQALNRPGLISQDFNNEFGGQNAGADILLTGENNAERARARRAAGAAQFSGREGTALAEPAADTTAAQQRRERAGVEGDLNGLLLRLGTTVAEAIRGQSAGISINVDKIAKILEKQGLIAPATSQVRAPGSPNRGGNQ